jgi:hypothetical protein
VKALSKKKLVEMSYKKKRRGISLFAEAVPSPSGIVFRCNLRRIGILDGVDS